MGTQASLGPFFTNKTFSAIYRYLFLYLRVYISFLSFLSLYPFYPFILFTPLFFLSLEFL